MIFLSPLALLFGWRLLVDGDGRHRLQHHNGVLAKAICFARWPAAAKFERFIAIMKILK
jgi:hypothetical protein